MCINLQGNPFMFLKKRHGEEMSFLEHLEELRWAILKCVLAILVGMVICFTFADQIINFLISPTLQEELKIEIEMQAIRPAGMFTTYVNISLMCGFALALPFVLYQLWSFVSPGLLEKEKKYVPIVIFFSCILFLVGAAFAFYVLIPVMVQFFIQLYVPGIKAQWDIGFWVALVNKMVLIMGIVFQMPMVVAFLTWLRILSGDVLKRVWRVALVVIFIAAAIITPTGDPYTQTLVAIPLMILYFISMGIAMLIGRSRSREATEESDKENGDDGGNSEKPGIDIAEPDTPTLSRGSSQERDQSGSRSYWPEEDEYIYDYDTEMGYSEEPVDTLDDSEKSSEENTQDEVDNSEGPKNQVDFSESSPENQEDLTQTSEESQYPGDEDKPSEVNGQDNEEDDKKPTS